MYIHTLLYMFYILLKVMIVTCNNNNVYNIHYTLYKYNRRKF